MENDWKRTVHARDVGIFLLRKMKRKKVSRGRWKRMASTNAGPRCDETNISNAMFMNNTILVACQSSHVLPSLSKF